MHQNLIRVALQADDSELRDQLERTGTVEIVDAAPDVLVWQIPSDADRLPASLRAVLTDPHGPAVLAVTDTHVSRWFDEAMHAGVDQVACLPASPGTLGLAVAAARAQRNRRVALGPVGAGRGGRSAHVLTVFSTKGGSGKTVVATNLAVCFARQGRRTLLVDFDLHSGDDALVLGLSPRWTVLDLVQSPGELDIEKLAGFVTKHSSGVDVLPAPTRPDEEELVAIDRLEPLLDVARESYDVVVIDTSSQFAPSTLLAIDNTDTLLLVGASDVPTIKSLKIALETLELLEISLTDVRILMNRSGAKVGLEDRDVERTLRREITYTLPSDKAVPISVNRGQPVVTDNPRSRVGKALFEMARSLESAVGNHR